MKRIIPIIILVAAIGGGYWWFYRPTVAALEPATTPTGLVGSGTIEAESVIITAELGGRIIEIKVDEGDLVTAGQVLVELDKADLLAQQAQLESVVATAKANLSLASASARPEDVAMAQAQLAQAEVAGEGAKLIWQRASDLVKNPRELEARINQAQTQVTEAENSLEMARVNLKRAEIQAEAASRNQLNHAALVENEVAQYQVQAAQQGIELAEAALTGAQQQVENWTRLRNRPLSLIAQANAAEAAYQQTEAAILVAQANLNAVKAGPMPEDVDVARAQLLEAEAALEAVEVQLAKQTLTAPRDGLISQKLVNTGELAAPGTVLLELNDIKTVDLTVYIPETRIGEVQIGHKAQVYVDAYEGEVFEGVVNFMAHEAEFTPRNVQTQEERVNLVFAIKIKLDNPDHRLKPGMPADAEILPTLLAKSVETTSSSASAQVTPDPTATPTPVNTPTVAPTPTTAKVIPAATPAAIEAALPAQAEVIAWELNVRGGPGVDFEVITTLLKGEIVPVIETDPGTGWLQVQLPDGEKTGWISGSPTFVSIIE